MKKIKKWRSRLLVLVVLFFVGLGLAWWVWFSSDDPEKRALEFYKAAWVEGNVEKARAFGAPRADTSVLQGYITKGEDTPIMIAEYPIAGESYRMYYIYRPSDNSMFAVQLTKYEGEWVVSHYDRKENYSLQMINQIFPQLQWEEIQSP